MWVLARPMMSDCMRDETRLDVRLKEVAEDVSDSVQRLAETMRLTERAAAWLADGHFRLHPASLAALKQRGSRFAWLPWLIALAALAYTLAG